MTVENIKIVLKQNHWTLILFILVLVITILHYSTSIHNEPMHALYRKLYYIPILLAAFYHGLQGALFCSLGCVALYLPHLHFDHGADYLITNADRSLEIVLYLVIASITGAYSSYQKKLLKKLQQNNEDLKNRTQQLVAVQSALQKHERLYSIGLLGAGVSHEIKNPLASLKGILEIILGEEKKCSLEESQELSVIALQEINRIQEILNRFLSLTKTESDQVQPVSLKAVCQDMKELVKPERNRKRVDCKLSLPANDCIFYGPSSPIQQVLLNLLLNAIAFAKTNVSIELKDIDNGFEISVSNDGIGIPEHLREKIFEFFFSTRQAGNGLGLPISLQLMKQMSGDLKLTSLEHPTTFTMYIPKHFNFIEGSKHQLAIKKV